MKFAVERLSSVVAEINALEKEQQDILKRDASVDCPEPGLDNFYKRIIQVIL